MMKSVNNKNHKDKNKPSKNRVNTVNKLNLEKIKWSIISFLFLVGIMLEVLLEQEAMIYTVAAWAVLLILMISLLFYTKKWRLYWQFFKESYREMRQVTWPSRKVTIRITLLVIVMVVIITLLIFVLDQLLLWGVNLLTGHN